MSSTENNTKQGRLSTAERLVYWQGKRVQDPEQCGNTRGYDHVDNDDEAFFSMVLLVQAPDLLVMNGRYFYFLGLFNGGGETLFAIHVISFSFSTNRRDIHVFFRSSGTIKDIMPRQVLDFTFVVKVVCRLLIFCATENDHFLDGIVMCDAKVDTVRQSVTFNSMLGLRSGCIALLKAEIAPILLHKNARSQFAKPALQKMNELRYETSPHPPKSPVLPFTDYHFSNFLGE
uniref:Uncharacterized protein n=1 Tax=Angiostrongylus cantonensis TaxID=6313 RepID=A0A158P9K8_ANGCA